LEGYATGSRRIGGGHGTSLVQILKRYNNQNFLPTYTGDICSLYNNTCYQWSYEPASSLPGTENLKKLKIAYIGDGNNVANSWLNASLTLGFNLHLACPKGYEPDQKIIEKVKDDAPLQIKLSSDPSEAAQDADIINTDTWISMGQENEYQKRMEAFKNYQVNSSLLKVAKKDVLVMHCLPAHRGKEITDEVADGKHSVIFDQAENRLHMQKAILAMLLTEK
jgi:ornithine carbamoyltransferase